MFSTYEDYLLSKQISAKPRGFEIDQNQVHPMLFDWQQAGLQWLLRLGHGLAGWRMGLGKTLLQVEWARLVHEHTRAPVLIVCPLAVAKQTIREAKKIRVDIEYVRSMDEARLADTPITIVNFDMFRREFESWYWRKGGLVIDESSILSSYQGFTKKFIIPFMNDVAFGLCCTGTPARNDFMEIGNHAEALGVMDSSQMLANWFMSGGGAGMKTGEIVAGKYKLKPLGEEDFWRWITTWGLILDIPSVIGGDDTGYILPELKLNFHTLEVDHTRAFEMQDKRGQHFLFLPDNPSSTEMWAEKKQTYKDRVYKAIELIENEPDEYRVNWCDLDLESHLLYKELLAKYGQEAVVEVHGSDSLENKEAKLDAFSLGNVKWIVTKSKIAGLGLNWQHCARQTFVSTNYSWEKWTQAIARCQRYGQTRQVTIDMIASETEQGIIKSVKRKAQQDADMHKWIKKIYNKFGLWRTDRKELTADFGEMEMILPKWMNNGHY